MSKPDINLDAVFEALRGQPPRSRGGGRAIMFIAARRGEGVTTAARIAADQAGPATVYAIDLDLRRNALAKVFSARGPFGPKMDGRLNGESFYTLVDEHNWPVHELSPAFSYHKIGASRLHVGVFDARAMPAGARIAVSSTAHYWNAARAGGATVVIDAPALERSQIALRAAAHMDGVVLVAGSDPGAAPAALAAKTDLLAAGANLLGLIYTNASAPVMAMDRLMRQAG